MASIKLLNMKKTKYNNLLSIRPDSLIQENKIMIYSKNTNIMVQCNIFLKFVYHLKIIYGENIYVYDNIPKEGILFAGEIYGNKYIEIIIQPIDYCSRIIFKNIKWIDLNLLIKNNMMTQINWEYIYIINLPRRTDRKKEMIEKLEKAGINNYEFIEAIDGQDLNIIEEFNLFNKLNLKKKSQLEIVTSGHYACLLSHIKAIKKAKENNFSNIMILEDDVDFTNDFLNKLNIQVEKYDIIYLGGIIDKKKIFLNNWSNYDCIMGAYGYILNNSLYDKILTDMEKKKYYIDLYLIKNIQKNYKVILLNDFVKTNLKTSDTSSKSKKIIERLNYI